MEMNESLLNEETNEFVEVEELSLTPKPIGVYVKRNAAGKIMEINSSVFIDDFTGWEKIDEGFGDKFAHAQTQYKI